MAIVGFNFTKIGAERKNAVVGSVNISNNISIKDINEAKLGLATDRGAVRISFSYKTEYSPELAVISMEGDVLVLIDAKKQGELIENWKKSKILPKELAEPVMNHILDRCSIQALLLSKDLNLPAPVQLPKVSMNVPAAPAAQEKPEPKKKKK